MAIVRCGLRIDLIKEPKNTPLLVHKAPEHFQLRVAIGAEPVKNAAFLVKQVKRHFFLQKPVPTGFRDHRDLITTSSRPRKRFSVVSIYYPFEFDAAQNVRL